MYKVESLHSINKKEKSGTVVSLFAGTGGSSLGYKMAGFEVKLAVEFVEAAANNYRANHPSTIVLERDIREVSGKEILDKIGLQVGELDILDGSPPCASFSTAGKGFKAWGEVKNYSDTKQRTDDLFDEYIRLVKETKPKVFIAENVRGLIVSPPAKAYLESVLSQVSEDYYVDYELLNAAHFGVPQARERVIVMGVRKDLNKKPAYPVGDSKNMISVREAWEDLKNDEDQAEWLREKMKQYSIYPLLKELREPGRKHPVRFSLARTYWHIPSRTVTQTTGNLGAAGVCHPFEDRKMTVPEVTRLCSFPDDFIFLGSYEQQIERLGRSVPPLMMKAVAEAIRTNILDLPTDNVRKKVPSQKTLF